MVSGRGGLRVEPGKPKTLSWKIVGERCTLWVAGWGGKAKDAGGDWVWQKRNTDDRNWNVS